MQILAEALPAVGRAAAHAGASPSDAAAASVRATQPAPTPHPTPDAPPAAANPWRPAPAGLLRGERRRTNRGPSSGGARAVIVEMAAAAARLAVPMSAERARADLGGGPTGCPGRTTRSAGRRRADGRHARAGGSGRRRSLRSRLSHLSQPDFDHQPRRPERSGAARAAWAPSTTPRPGWLVTVSGSGLAPKRSACSNTRIDDLSSVSCFTNTTDGAAGSHARGGGSGTAFQTDFSVARKQPPTAADELGATQTAEIDGHEKLVVLWFGLQLENAFLEQHFAVLRCRRALCRKGRARS